MFGLIYMYISLKDMYMWRKKIPCQHPPVFTSTLGIFRGKVRLTRILQQKNSQWWSYWSNNHRNQHFPVTPTNIQIIEIRPSSRAIDSGKWLCAHLLLFDKTYHFMKSACISCMILTRACFIHLFLDFSAENENEYVLIREYFGFIHAFNHPPAVFRN